MKHQARHNHNVAGTAADPLIQFAELELDGQDYRLAYSFNSIAEAEKVAGCNLLSGLWDLSNLTALQLRGLFYGALRIAHPDMTIATAGDLIRIDTTAAILEALGRAYGLSMPPKKPANPPEAVAPPAETFVAN